MYFHPALQPLFSETTPQIPIHILRTGSLNRVFEHYPDRKKKVLNRLLNLKGGVLNRKEFNERFQSMGPYDEQYRQLFTIHSKRLGLDGSRQALETQHFRRPGDAQLTLF